MGSNQENKALASHAGYNRQEVLARHLHKTKLCIFFFQKGKCKRGSECDFAHGESELLAQPSLYKTRMCPNIKTCSKENCTYAHSHEEVRYTATTKTKMCMWHSVGQCCNGEACHFAHSKEELRGIPTQEENYASIDTAKADQGKQKVHDKLPHRGGRVSKDATRDTESKTQDPRRSAAKKIGQADNATENLGILQEVTHFPVNQPMLIRRTLDEHSSACLQNRWGFPAPVPHKLLESSGFLDPLRSPNSGSKVLPPPGLQQQINFTDSNEDWNIIPSKLAFEQATQIQKSNFANPDITLLAESIQSLSEQVSKLQQRVVAKQSYQKTSRPRMSGSIDRSSPPSSQHKSESVKSSLYFNESSEVSPDESSSFGALDTDFNHSSTGNSSPATPDSYSTQEDQQFQSRQFSKELQIAVGFWQ